MIFSLRWIGSLLISVLCASAAQAVPLSVDISAGTDTPLQPGFVGFSSAVADSPSTTNHMYMADFGTGPGGTVSVTISGNTHYRDYPAVTSGPHTGQSALLSDNVLRNADGTMTLRLENLIDGIYEITTYHHDTQNAGGTFNVYLTDSVLTDEELFTGEVTSTGTGPAAITTLTFPFSVIGGSPVEIDFERTVGSTGDNHLSLNGFVLFDPEIFTVPEPASLVAWTLLGAAAVGGVFGHRRRPRA